MIKKSLLIFALLYFFGIAAIWLDGATTCYAKSEYAVVLGNEVKGVQQAVIDECHACLEIPQFGTKHSLNVSVTAGIVIWEFVNKLGLSSAGRFNEK